MSCVSELREAMDKSTITGKLDFVFEMVGRVCDSCPRSSVMVPSITIAGMLLILVIRRTVLEEPLPIVISFPAASVVPCRTKFPSGARVKANPASPLVEAGILCLLLMGTVVEMPETMGDVGTGCLDGLARMDRILVRHLSIAVICLRIRSIAEGVGIRRLWPPRFSGLETFRGHLGTA